MNAAIAGTALLALILGWDVRAAGLETSMAVVRDGSNAELTRASLIRIRQFILAQGRRRTYCARFNNNPYWAFPGFNAYLNPPDQRNINCEIGKSEFNELVIEVIEPTTKYWCVLLDETGKELRLRREYFKEDPQALIEEVSRFFKIALAEIDRQTKR